MSSRSVLALAVAATLIASCASAGAPTNTGAPSPSTAAPPTVSVTATLSPSPSPSPPPSPSPSAEATVPTEWSTYTSERYSYAIDYPTDWIATPAIQDWPSDANTYPDDSAIDKWALPDRIWVLMFVSSVPLGEGETREERFAKVDRDNAQDCVLSNRRDVVVDGVPARQEEGMCFGRDYMNQVIVVNEGRFYLIYILSGNPFTETSLATFDHFVNSFRFL